MKYGGQRKTSMIGLRPQTEHIHFHKKDIYSFYLANCLSLKEKLHTLPLAKLCLGTNPKCRAALYNCSIHFFHDAFEQEVLLVHVGRQKMENVFPA